MRTLKRCKTPGRCRERNIYTAPAGRDRHTCCRRGARRRPDVLKSEKLYWIVDPIDGTYNYLRSIPGCLCKHSPDERMESRCRRNIRLHPRRAFAWRQICR
ncbi:MAG: inositol monophosphatase family protein [Bacilli bacterium]